MVSCRDLMRYDILVHHYSVGTQYNIEQGLLTGYHDDKDMIL